MTIVTWIAGIALYLLIGYAFSKYSVQYAERQAPEQLQKRLADPKRAHKEDISALLLWPLWLALSLTLRAIRVIAENA